VRGDLLVNNWQAALAAGAITTDTDPRAVNVCGVGPAGPFIPAAVASFFRPGGLNPSLTPFVPAPCLGLVNQVLKAEGLGFGPNRSTCDPVAGTCVPIPFSDQAANYSNGSSVYHGLSVNFRKRFSGHAQFLASYTWSHAIDDSTDLQSPLSPQDSFNPGAERATSTFDQRHRFVFSGSYDTGRVGKGGIGGKLLSNWTFAPIIDVASGRPFNIITTQDTTFQFAPSEARPNVVPAGTLPTPCDPQTQPVASRFSPTGFFQVPCFREGSLAGNLGRNAGLRPWTLFNDLRVARTFPLGERFSLEGIMDLFNIANRYNVADVNPLYSQAGVATAASDPRQFQFAVRLKW